MWLGGSKDYNVGVRLYRIYGKDEKLKRLFGAEQKTAFKQAQLFAALKNIVEAPAVEQAEKVKSTAAQITPAIFYKTWTAEENTDEILKTLWEKARLLLKQIGSIHGSLTALADDSDRRSAALLLLELDDDLSEVYDQRDYYKKHSKLQHVQAEGKSYLTKPMEIANRIVALNRYVRRYKLALRKNAADTKAAELLKQYDDELAYYKNMPHA